MPEKSPAPLEVIKGKGMPKKPPRSKYPFHDMAVGDTFFVQAVDPRKSQITLMTLARRIQGKKFKTRADYEAGRVWVERIK